MGSYEVDDRLTLIRSYLDWKEYARYVILENVYWFPYRRSNASELQKEQTFEKLFEYMEPPKQYPCMVHTTVDHMDMKPGWDFESIFFYVEDAEKLLSVVRNRVRS